MKVKICGITRYEDAELSLSLGAWAIGFIFYKGSPRSISPEAAFEIINRLPDEIRTVGVFVNEAADEVRRIMSLSKISILQFHGEETPEYCESFGTAYIKAIRGSSLRETPESDFSGALGVLVDSGSSRQPGGTGVRLPLETLKLASKHYPRLIAAGGIDPSNVQEIISAIRPYAIDLSSGVESAPGIKCPGRLTDLFRKIKETAC